MSFSVNLTIDCNYPIERLPNEALYAIIIKTLLEDRVQLTEYAHTSLPEWTYRKLNDKGLLVLEPATADDGDGDVAGSSFYVRLPFVWLQLYLMRLASTSRHLLSEAFKPLLSLMKSYVDVVGDSTTATATATDEFDEFNSRSGSLLMALRINLRKLKNHMEPACQVMPHPQR